MSKQQSMDETIRAWNEAHPVGSEVTFDGHTSTVAAPAQVCFGEPMAFMRGVRGPVPIANLSAPEAHPVGSDAAFANIGESCLGEPMVFLPDARGPVAIAKLSPTAPEMLALIEHAKHGAWVARNKASATGNDDRREEYEGEAANLDVDEAGRAAGLSPVCCNGRWHWFDDQGRIVPGPKVPR